MCGLYCVLQILVNTAQQRQALNEVEQRHREIMALEQDIRVIYDCVSMGHDIIVIV